jgi:hypothetical protein
MNLITESTITVVDSWKSLIETQGGDYMLGWAFSLSNGNGPS